MSNYKSKRPFAPKDSKSYGDSKSMPSLADKYNKSSESIVPSDSYKVEASEKSPEPILNTNDQEDTTISKKEGW